MTPADFAALSAAIAPVLAKHPNVADDYARRGLSAARMRWDVLHASGFNTVGLYRYLNDDNIDTALRRIIGPACGEG